MITRCPILELSSGIITRNLAACTPDDAADFYLTTAKREEERDENLVTASRMFAAMARTEIGSQAVASALTEVFPRTRHLSGVERIDFAVELISALSDAAELTIDVNAHEVIAGWRATARIKADKRQAAAFAMWWTTFPAPSG